MVSEAAGAAAGGGGGARMKVRMGAPKQKWTAEEESALRAGVEKYGPGKWRAIQRDPKFGPALVARSNVDLKDKWRNLSVSSGHSRVPRSKMRRISKTTERAASVRSFSGSSESEEGEEEDDEDDEGSETPPVYNQRKQLGSRYDDLVSEAILTLKEPNGSDISAIASYIEEHQRVPSRFRKLLALKLKALTAQGKLVKVGKSFIVKERDYVFCGKTTAKAPRLRRQEADEGQQQIPPKLLRTTAMFDVNTARSKMKTAEEAARLAAQAVADAEAAAVAAEQAAREAEAAEVEAEAAEAAAEAAAMAARPGKPVRIAPVPDEAVAVTV